MNPHDASCGRDIDRSIEETLVAILSAEPIKQKCGVCEGTGTIEYEVQQAGEIVTKSVPCPICQIPSEPVS